VVLTALRDAGYDASITIEPWARLLVDVEKGRFDGVVAIWRTDERDKFVLFSAPYYTNRIMVLARADSSMTFAGKADLAGKVVGVGRAYDYTPDFVKDDSFIKEPAMTALQNFKKLAAGRVDAVIEDDCIARFELEKKPAGADLLGRIKIFPTPLYEIPLHFGMSKELPAAAAVIEKFDRSLAAMQRRGDIESIWEKHGIGGC
jgi:polar amino acid transport system substrate-binding protein